MTFQPYPARSNFIFLGIAVLFGAITIFLITLLPQQIDRLDTFQLLVGLLATLALTGIALYWALIAFRLQYDLNRNGLVIRWGLARQIIPFDSIEKIVPGQSLSPSPEFGGYNLAGLRFGRGAWTGYGQVKIFTTAPPANSLLVATPDQAYLISPHDPDEFLTAWQVRQGLGPTQKWSTGVQRSWPLSHPLFTDPLAWWLLGVAVVAFLALFGYLSLIFADLPPALPIHFNALGRADRIADKSALFTLPAAGAIVLGLNTLLGSLIYRREKVAAYLLWGSAVVVQLCLWIALRTITA